MLKSIARSILEDIVKEAGFGGTAKTIGKAMVGGGGAAALYESEILKPFYSYPKKIFKINNAIDEADEAKARKEEYDQRMAELQRAQQRRRFYDWRRRPSW